MKILLIDFSQENEIKILKAKITSSITIESAFMINYKENDDYYKDLQRSLEERKLLNLPVYIVPLRKLVKTQVFNLPKMPVKEIRAILPREINSATGTSDPVILDFIHQEYTEEKQVKKIEVSAFYITRKEVFEFLDQLKNHGIAPISLIPEIQGLTALLNTHRKDKEEKGGTILIDIKDNTINLNIFKKNFWSLSREFHFRYEPAEELNEDELSRIIVEVNRTIQFFKQRNRNYYINNALLFGDISRLTDLQSYFRENLPMSSDIFTLGLQQTKISLPQSVEDTEEFVQFFSVALGTLLSIQQKKYLNLFPVEYREKEILPKRIIGFTISAIIIFFILTVGIIYLNGIKKSYRRELKKINKSYFTLNSKAAIIETTKNDRIKFFKNRFFLDFPAKYSFSIADFLRRLSLISSVKIHLTEIEITPKGESFYFLLKGFIMGQDNIRAQSEFLSFFRQLKDFDNIFQVNSSKVRVNSSRQGELKEYGKKEDSGNSGSNSVELYFTISGDYEL